MSTEALRKLNQLDHNEPLKLGQKIALSGSSSSTKNTASNARETQTFSPANKSASSTPASTNNKGKTTYTVKSGDTLMAISRKYKLNVNDISRWNGMGKNQTALKPGQSLTLYLDASNKH